ncbi:hypothetical protein B5F32_15545 [Parabacteroides distasonis]|uniref:Uncharacterized protein n=1 Tax=Parabacteroides distasonis TaxID=823 RepID=A0A1Y4I8L2_PARDI|nr:hypothetical protein [Parabacteroides distasonis]OUP16594.1 hypothetical protein B5F32_15545 [Parabacteroides distasonis]
MANNLYFEVKADFLKTPLDAKLFKKDKQMMLLVEPQDTEQADEIDIKDLIAKLKGDTANIGDAFGGKAEGVKIRLSMAYLKYLQVEAPATPDQETPKEPVKGDAVSGMEYALKLEVLDINTLPIFKKIGDIITVNKVTLAVWNTDDIAVTEKMKLAIPAFTNKVIQAPSAV